MKLAFITPTAHLNDFAIQSNFHLVLPHLYVEHPTYSEFYRERSKRGDFIIQDTSVFELDTPLSNEDLVETANFIGASEMVAPEVLRDAEGSKILLEQFLEYKSKVNCNIPVMAVVQGKTFVEISRHWAYLLNISEVATIGLPFVLDFDTPASKGIKSLTLKRVLNRWYVLDTLQSASQLNKPVHLLGLADGVELQHYINNPMIRSNDSSSAFVHGSEMVYYTERGLPCEKIQTKLDFKTRLTSHKQYEVVQHNIDMLKNFATV